jgi:hypothetical protein
MRHANSIRRTIPFPTRNRPARLTCLALTNCSLQAPRFPFHNCMNAWRRVLLSAAQSRKRSVATSKRTFTCRPRMRRLSRRTSIATTYLFCRSQDRNCGPPTTGGLFSRCVGRLSIRLAHRPAGIDTCEGAQGARRSVRRAMWHRPSALHGCLCATRLIATGRTHRAATPRADIDETVRSSLSWSVCLAFSYRSRLQHGVRAAAERDHLRRD